MQRTQSGTDNRLKCDHEVPRGIQKLLQSLSAMHTHWCPAHKTWGAGRAGVVYHPAGCDAPLLSGLDMELRNRSLGLVYGRSGSGKTTLLQMLAGLREHTAGTICTVTANGAHATRKPLRVFCCWCGI